MDPRRTIRRHLELLRDAWPESQSERLGLVYRGPADFVLQHGRWWKPVPYPIGAPRGAPKHCFGNALGLAVLLDLKYVQGYAISPVEPDAVVPHAWNGEQGCAIDSTWNPRGIAYLGVALSVERADDGTWWGDADPIDDKNRGWPLLREKWRGEKAPDPAWVPSPPVLALRARKAGDLAAAMRYSEEGWREAEGATPNRGVDFRVMSEIVTPEELRDRSDAELVRLIEERSSLRGDAAREALAIIRGGPGDVEVES